MNAIDYSSYPDCRPDYIAAVQATAWLVTNPGLAGDASTSHTPPLPYFKIFLASYSS